MYERHVKRCLDLFIFIVTLPLLLPLIFIFSLVIFIQMGRPIFFTQKRGGYKGHPIRIFKFRTMMELRDSKGDLLPDIERTTRLGSFLRRASLDEIPSVLNVLLGHMSIVGPRPLIYEYVSLYSPEQARRHDVRPGITGWAQINGRNSISWSEKFKLDIWYVDNISFLLDLKIIFYTILKVIKRADIDQNESMTMEKFNGSN